MRLIKNFMPAFATVLLLAVVTGCSGTGDANPSGPPLPLVWRMTDSADRVLWGYYEIHVDPVACEMRIVPLREACAHLNALKYIETPTSTLVTLESPPKFGGGKVRVDIGLTHPLPLKIYTGFDVRGILITRGCIEFDGGYNLPGQGDFRLLNPDGYTRFWNPTEFTGSGYQDGILGTPHSVGQFDATVNGFKYFADGLGANDPLEGFGNPLRGAFSAGGKNVRHYVLKIGSAGLLFNYAVDASWQMPAKIPPTIPDDFDVNKANSKEAWLLAPRIDNFFTPDGGECYVEVDVYDWQGAATIEGVYIQAPDIFSGSKALANPVDHGNYVTYSITFTNELGAYGENLPVLIRAKDVDAASNPNLEAFQLASLSIVDVVITLAEDEAYKTPGTDYNYAAQPFDLAAVPPPVDYLDLDGPWDFAGIAYTEEQHRVMFATDDPQVSGFVNDFPADVECFVREAGTGGYIYRAEEHNEAASALYLHGLYSLEDFQGSLVFGKPVAYPYPQDKNTDFTVTKQVVIIPFILTIKFVYDTKAIGQGWAKVPYNGGAWFNCLYLRSTIEMYTVTIVGEEWAGTALLYEWVEDDGILVAQTLSGNEKDKAPNFDDGTFEIIGQAAFLGLDEITTF